MHLRSQRYFSGRSVQPYVGRDLITKHRFVRGRTSEGPEQGDKNGKPNAQVASRSDSGVRHRGYRRTSRSNRPRTDNDRNGNHVYRGYHHLVDTGADTADHARDPAREGKETQGLLIHPRAISRTTRWTGCHHPGGRGHFCRIGTAERFRTTLGHFNRTLSSGLVRGVWTGEEPSRVLVAAHYPVRLVREKGA